MEKLLTVQELAEMLGITKVSVYQLVWRKRIPAVQISKKCLRFDPVEIREWLSSKKTQVVSPAPKQPVRKSPGRPRGGRRDGYIDVLVEKIKQEVKGGEENGKR